MLVLAPFWALQWQRQPFLGLFLEPHLVVSQVRRADWPARQAGVPDYAQLIAVNGQKVEKGLQVSAVLRGQFAPARLTFRQQDGTALEYTVRPRNFRSGELFLWFGIPYLVGLAIWGIGVWAYRLSAERRSAAAFLNFTSAASVITAGYFDMNTTQHFLLGWSLSLAVAGGALLYLALDFPRPIPLVRRFQRLHVIPALLTFAFAIPLTREILWPSSPWGYIPVWLASYGMISLGILSFLGSLILRVARSRSPIVRQQSRIIVFGAALAFGPIMVTFLLPSAFGQLVRFQAQIAFPSLVFFPLSVAYALVRYRMLDVDRWMSVTLGYGLAATAAVGLYYALLTLISVLTSRQALPNDPLVIALYLFLLVISLNPLRRLMMRAIDRLFYRTRADYRRSLMHLSQQLSISPEMEHTLHLLEQELHDTLAPQRVLVYLYDDGEAQYRPHSSRSLSAPSLAAEHPLPQALQDSPTSLWLPESRPLPPTLAPFEEQVRQVNCEVYTPLRYKGQMIGFLALGKRRSGEPYSRDDLEFLDAIAGQSALALENVRLFANLQATLNETLEMKNLMDDIFASMSSGVITTDMQHKITLFNQAASRILGIPLEEALGKPMSRLLPGLGERILQVAEFTLSHNKVVNEELAPVLPGRGSLYLHLSCSPLRDAHADTKGATIVIDDLTEQRKLAAERERIRQTFGRVVAPRVRDRLLSDPGNLQLDGIRQPLTVLFADIHNFTPFSENTPPETLFHVLNSYLSIAADVVLAEEGTLDKFMGDAVMAFWNAPDRQPDHVLRAVRAAWKIRQAVEIHRARQPRDQRLFFSIGINTGEAMVGNVGTRELFNYTAIGDAVNFAQRLEAAALPGQILLAEAVYRQVADAVVARQLPPLE
ncbi:MAG: PAS domain S-box protein, partial [Anaerolineae bacterium]